MERTRRWGTTSRTAITLATTLLLLSNSDTLFGSAFAPSSSSSSSSNAMRHPPAAAAVTNRMHDYLPEPSAGPLADKCRLTEDQIHILISKRQECKRRRQYDDADKILEGLNKAGVYVHDKRKEWRADGQNYFGRDVQFTRRGGTYGLSEEDVMAVSQLVKKRYYAKKSEEYHISDQIVDTLKSKYQVKVNDKKREWAVVVSNWDKNKGTDGGSGSDDTPHYYVPSPLAPPEDPTHTMNDESKAHIAQRLADRVALRKKKDYRTADKIRDELMEQYSIIVDDRTREWKVVLGDIADDDFAREAQLSQRSAFVRREDDGSKDRIKTRSRSDDGDDDLPAPNKEDIKTEQRGVITSSNEKNTSNKDESVVEQVDLASLTVVELKQLLRRAGLPVSGKKIELIARLKN